MKKVISYAGIALLIGNIGVASASIITGGDLPFPLDREENGVKLHEVWENMESSRQVKIYKDDSGEVYVIIRDLRSGKVEVLRKVQ